MDGYQQIPQQTIVLLIVTIVIAFLAPLTLAIVWKVKKKEKITTILIGAAVFLVFALILEKPVQNALLFPEAMMLPSTKLSLFMASHPVLLSLAAGLFPGVFEETGRFIAFKTGLKKRTNRETSISFGIGHGGFEVLLLLGYASVQYLMYAVMINTGEFQVKVDQLAEIMPSAAESLNGVYETLLTFTASGMLISMTERVFAVLFHIGASILVFYACKEKKKFWLFPLAVALHTAMDFVAALSIFEVISLSGWALEAFVAVFGTAVFFVPYLLLYRKDKAGAEAS